MRIFALVSLLAACAKAPAPQTQASTVPPSTAAAAAANLARTENLSEAEVIAAAAAASLGGANTLSAVTSLRCWEREERRPRVREACMLAWAAAGEESAEMRSVLRQALSAPNRVFAIAAARRAGFAKTLAEPDFKALLGALKEEAPWLRALAALSWLETNIPASPGDAEEIFDALSLPELDGSPVTLAGKFAVAGRLGLEREADWLRTQYCAPGISGPAATRCLRVLSALMDRRFGAPAPYLRANLPPKGDSGTTFFQRSFPSRAHDLDALY